MPANIKQVAKAAGVGTTTVSVILNKPDEAGRFSQETIDHVRQVAETLGYQPNQRARSFRGGRTQVIGLAVEYYGQSRSPLAEPYVGALAGGIQAALWKKGYNLLLVAGHAEENSAEIGCNFIRQGRIDGLVLLSPPSPALLRKNADLKSRMILIRPEGPRGLACVYSDDAAGAALAVEAFVKHGRRDLLWIGPREWYDDSPLRRAGAFVSACAEWKIRGVSGAFSSADGFHSYHLPHLLSDAARDAAAKALNRKRPPTGILCYNPQCATGVYEAIHKAGLKIPEDIAVITFEEFASNFFLPHLTAVSLRWPEVGARAGKRLLDLLNNNAINIDKVDLIPPELFAGQSK
jgi:LacI family transcriptional regulator